MSKELSFSMRMILAAALVLAGCASTPAFSPSMPIQKAPSFQEAVALCNEYQMPQPAERPVALKPFLDCLTETEEHFRLANWDFQSFLKEFRFRYDLLQEGDWTSNLGNEVEIATHAALRFIATQENAGTNAERSLLMRHFPETAEVMKTGTWRITRPLESDARLERLKAAIVSLRGRSRGLPAPPETCKRFKKLREEAGYLTDLLQDRQTTPNVPVKFEMRLGQAWAELDQLRDLRDFKFGQC